MTRADCVAAALCWSMWAALVPVIFHHYLPLACWLTAWIVVVVLKPESRNG